MVRSRLVRKVARRATRTFPSVKSSHLHLARRRCEPGTPGCASHVVKPSPQSRTSTACVKLAFGVGGSSIRTSVDPGNRLGEGRTTRCMLLSLTLPFPRLQKKETFRGMSRNPESAQSLQLSPRQLTSKGGQALRHGQVTLVSVTGTGGR